MLEFMRKKRNSAIIVGAFALIIIAFIFWVPSFQQGGSSDSTIIATVNKTRIPLTVYNSSYQRELDRYRSFNFTPQMLEKLDLKKTVLDRLINKILILNQADKDRIEISKTDVQNVIMGTSYFQKDGVFDKNLYFAVLENNRIKPDDYESGVREDLIIRKMGEAVTKDITVVDAEAKEAFSRENRKVSFNYVTFDPKPLEASIPVKNEDAEAYLKSHGELFQVPDRIKAVYAVVDKTTLTKGVSVSEKDVKELYELKKEEYKQPIRLRARHILVKFDEMAPDKAKDKAEAKSKIEDILRKIKGGEDFAALAKQYSDDKGSAANGGDLDYFTLGTMVKPFEDALIALKKGEVSGIVETQFGFHVIKLEDKKNEEYKSLSEVRNDLETTLKRQKGSRMIEEKVSALHGAFKGNAPADKLKSEAAKAGAKFFETGFFTDRDANVELAKERKLADAAFILGKGETGGVVDLGEKLYIIKIVDRVDRHVPPLKDVLSDVTKRIKEEKALELAKKNAEAFAESLKSGASFADAAKKGGLKVSKTAQVSFVSGTIKEIPLALTENVSDLFALNKQSPNYTKALTSGAKFVVLSFNDTTEADAKDFEGKKADISRRLLTKKKEEAYKKWLEELRAKAEIKINSEYL